MIKKLMEGKKMGRVGKAEIKMAVIILYYIIVGFVSQMTLTYFEIRTKANRDSLDDCGDATSDNPKCGVKLDGVSSLDVLSLMAIIMVTFLPVVAVVFSLDLKACKQSIVTSKKTSITH